MLPIDLSNKRAFVAGVADDGGFGFAIAKALAEAGATVCLGTWPPALGIFKNMLERGKIDESLTLAGRRKLAFERIYPLDADFDTLEDDPGRDPREQALPGRGDFSVAGAAARLQSDFGAGALDIVVHSLANGPEVHNAADRHQPRWLPGGGVRQRVLQRLARPPLRAADAPGRLVPLAHVPGQRARRPRLRRRHVVGQGRARVRHPDARLRGGPAWGARVNAISAGPYASRAASARLASSRPMIEYTTANSPLPRAITAEDVGATAAFLLSPLAAAITGSVVYVDKGYHAMGMAVTGAHSASPGPAS